MEKILSIFPGEYFVYYLTDLKNLYAAGSSAPVLPNIVDAAAGMHSGLAVDATGHVWTFGLNDSGQAGNGTINNSGAISPPFQVVRDVNGQPFGGVVHVWSWYSTNIAQKKDGTLWIWGADALGIMGGNAVYPHPLVMPAGVTIKKVVAQVPLLALDNVGGVWEWRSGNPSPVKVLLPAAAQDIAACPSRVSYAVVGGYPYGWGPEGAYMGLPGSGGPWNPVASPIPLKDVWGLKSPIVAMAGTINTTHFIDANGDLWGLGDNAQGEVGIGGETDWIAAVPVYAWTWAKYGLMVYKPVQVSAGTKFQKITGGSSWVFYSYAQDVAGNWYSWGRNKGAILGNGLILGNNGQDEATWPNLLDVTKPTMVIPLCVPTVQLVVKVTNGIPAIVTAAPPPPAVLFVVTLKDGKIFTMYSDGTYSLV